MLRGHWFSKFVLLSVVMGSAVLSCANAQAAILLYIANMTGAAEAPPNNSPATGLTRVTIDTVLNTMRVQSTFTGLTGNTTAAHIHAATVVPGTGTAGVATTTPSFVGFPLGVTSGSMDQLYDLTLNSSYNAAYITANGGTAATAQTALINSIVAGTAYFNIHTSAFPGGEIRGFLVPVPEPGSMALAGTFALGALARTWRKRRTAVKPA